ncbi:T9SS type A sorting domain-containing protein [Gracilimonas sp.]|uniref:T9SS type A sorting domain-containing protein n=1 Tax=Gracilimonas sp. TaxID=1974203 RepID=UPI003BA86A31
MKRTFTIILTTLLVALFSATGAMAQDAGDYRSTADGDWSVVATWETYDGTDWVAATTAPDGSESITVLATDSVAIDIAVTISGTLTLEGSGPDEGGIIEVAGGSLAVADGGTYNHARDGGSVPVADWQTGSTIVFSGILGSGPDNRDQAFHNITWNNPGQVSNISLGLGTVTISGDVRVVDTGSNRFRLTDSGSGDGETITIEGDVIVESGAIETTGSSSTATYNVVVNGDVIVHGGTTFATSRGSGGKATWTLGGDFAVMGDATLRDSHDGDSSRVVFAGSSTQNISIGPDVSYNGAFSFTSSGSDVVVPADSMFQYEDEFSLEGTLTVNGTISARDTLSIDGGTMTVASGGTYNHDHDAGEIPTATWADGSTIHLTGIETNDPDNGEQDFFNYTWDNAGQIENINIGWDDYTLRGSMSVLNTNGNQFRLTSAGDTGDPARSITIMGDVVVDGGSSEFTATGSGDVFDYDITVMGDISITNGGFLSVSRGSGGRAVWTLYGDMTIDSGEIGDSDIDKHGQTRSFVFAADTASDGVPGQTLTANDVTYDSEVYFEIADSAGVLLASGSDFAYEGVFTNYGVFDVDGGATLTLTGESTYDHARDGGDFPTATWAEGSTALITGTVTSAPGNGNQDFYNLVINATGNIENNDLGMMDNTIGGNIDIMNTGTARFYLSNPDSFDSLNIDIMGDIYMAAEASAFSSNGTGSGATEININHYGDITVDGGNFSISRGSGPIVNWYMHGGSITFNAGETQNSNARSESAFVFAGQDTVQHLNISEAVDISHLPIRVATGAYLDLGTSNLSESGDHFTLEAGGTLASSDSAAFSAADGGNLELGGSGSTILSLSSEANYVINGSIEQWTGFALPLQIGSLTIDNEAGVTQSRGMTINDYLTLSAGVFDNTIGFNLAEEAIINYDGGSLLIPFGGPSIGAFNLTSPEDGFALDLTGDVSTEVAISWEEPSAPDSVTYTWHADSVGGDFSNPLVSIPSDNEGAATTLTLTYEAIDDVVADLGVEVGEDIDLIWTVTAQAGITTRFAESSFDLNIARNLGVSNEMNDQVPTEFALKQNYPNPFNPTTTIGYDVPEATDVSIKVYDITGRLVSELVNGRKAAGSYEIKWNASQLATGLYIYRIKAGNYTAVRKLTLIK